MTLVIFTSEMRTLSFNLRQIYWSFPLLSLPNSSLHIFHLNTPGSKTEQEMVNMHECNSAFYFLDSFFPLILKHILSFSLMSGFLSTLFL